MVPRGPFVADTRPYHQPFSRDDRNNTSFEVRTHVDGKLYPFQVVLYDGFRHVFAEKTKLFFVVGLKHIDTATSTSRFDDDRVGNLLEMKVLRQTGCRSFDPVQQRKFIHPVLVVGDLGRLFARNRDPNVIASKARPISGEDRQLNVDCRNDQMDVLDITNALNDRNVFGIARQGHDVIAVSEIESRGH